MAGPAAGPVGAAATLGPPPRPRPDPAAYTARRPGGAGSCASPEHPPSSLLRRPEPGGAPWPTLPLPPPPSRTDARDPDLIDPGPGPGPDEPDRLASLGPAPDDPPAGWADRVAELRGRLGLDVRLAAWVVVAVVAAGAAAWLLRPAPTPFEETLPTAATEAAVAGSGPVAAPAGAEGSTTSALPTELVVHAAGAVVGPGVYRLDPAARVDDLVRAAGGLAPDADAARINLAAPLADGARVYVPRVGEDAPPEVAAPDGAAVPAGPGDAPTGAGEGAALVDINTADEAGLDELPGVGPAIAGAILAYRTEHGGFSSVDELLEVRGIGEAKLAEIRPLVTT